MICRKCRGEIKEDFSFCPYCQDPVNQREGLNTIDAGHDNVNIGLGINSKQEFYIDNRTVATDPANALVVDYEELPDRKVWGGVKGYKLKFEVSGVLSVISAVITIVTYFFRNNSFILFLIMTTIGLAVYALDSRNKHRKLLDDGVYEENKRPILFEDEEGDVYSIKKYGYCPICGGRVNLIKDERFKRTVGKCENNSDHLYSYDHTINKGFPFEVVEFYSHK
ncbi:hypothetical protein NST84_17325 [Paenibacillus sp. FSL R7-0345]|uniref:hypothetical protein n=1 Tax=Paenibacillus sp. FSL R7-0345 TaxID=2954535 RepID=UPI00315B0109